MKGHCTDFEGNMGTSEPNVKERQLPLSNEENFVYLIHTRYLAP